jgi:DNA polymerase-3 subunit delta'
MRSLLVSGDSPARLREEALALARGLLCPSEEDDPTCSICRRIGDNTHPDLFHVRPDGVQIKVEDVREAVRFASGRPYEARARLIWIELAETLKDAGANALLKSLEEPGESVQWLLTTTAPESILATVRSRCDPRRLAPRPPSEILARLESAGLSASDSRDAAAFGFDANEPFDLESARENRRLFLGALANGSTSALLSLAALAASDDSAPALAASLLRDAAILASGAPPDRLRHAGGAAELSRIAASYRPESLREAARNADALRESFERSRQKRLAFEKLFLGLSRGRTEK